MTLKGKNPKAYPKHVSRKVLHADREATASYPETPPRSLAMA